MIAGLILAGGNATRLGGGDKPLLRIGERTILDLLLDRLRPQVRVLAISANGDPARYAGVGLPVLADEVFLARGPLGGIVRGLHWAAAQGADSLLSVPGDTPFIPADLAERLVPGPSCAEDSDAVHWPVALWPVDCATALADWLGRQKSGRVSSFASLIGMRKIWFADAAGAFHNINTQADLETARLRV